MTKPLSLSHKVAPENGEKKKFISLDDRKLRVDPRNSFIAALAFSDLTLCVFTSPLTLWYTLEGHWPSTLDFGKQGWH